MRHRASRISPYFRAGGFVVNARIVGIGKLVEHSAFAFLLHPFGQVARIFDAATFRRQDQLGAKGLHGLGAFDAQVLRHDQNHAVTLDRGGHGQRDARVARSGLDQRVARLDVAAFLGAPDHGQRRAVLDRAGRIVAFEFAQDDVAAHGVFSSSDALQGDQRRFSDRIFNS